MTIKYHAAIFHLLVPLILLSYCQTTLAICFSFPIINIQSKEALSTNELPLIEIPSTIDNPNFPLIFLISGDGGWTKFDQSLCENLAKMGFPTVALNARRYFWNLKTPEETSMAISKVIPVYLQKWHKKSFLFAGYSFGADLIPFVTSQFNSNITACLKGIYCLSPDLKADFEVHLGDMVGFINKNDKLDVTIEMDKVRIFNPVCLFGEEEPIEIREQFLKTGCSILTVAGDHHYNKDAKTVAAKIFEELEKSILPKK